MFENDDVIERKYADKATAYAMGLMHGGMIGLVGTCISCIVLYILLAN